MTLESHIRRLLIAEDERRPDPIDSYDSIVSRGKRRRRVYYATRVAAVAVVAGLIVGGTGLLSSRTQSGDPAGPEVIPIAPVTSTLPEDAVQEVCDPTAAMRLAEAAVAELGQPDVTGWQAGLEGPIVERRMPTAHDLAIATGLRCEWEGSIPSSDGEWITASVAWSGQDMLGVVRLTHPPNQNYGNEATYGFEETGVITGTWVTPSIFAGIADGELTAVFRMGSVEPPTAPPTTTTTTIDFGVCPGIVPGFLPEGVEGGPGIDPISVWESTGAATISIAHATSPDHPAANLENTTTVEFDGGSASYVSLRPDDPMLNFVARIDINGTDPACGFLAASFFRLDRENVESFLSSLTVVQDGEGLTDGVVLDRLTLQTAVDDLIAALPEEVIASSFASHMMNHTETSSGAIIFFKGEVPSEAQDLLDAAGLVGVELRGGLEYTLDELISRQNQIHTAVVALGFTQVISGIDVETQQITLEVSQRADLAALRGPALVAAIAIQLADAPPSLRIQLGPDELRVVEYPPGTTLVTLDDGETAEVDR